MPNWLTEQVVRALHSEAILEHGGFPGPPQEGALEAPLMRPKNLPAYGNQEPPLSRLAAAYGYALARGHCFPDGNKRVALASMDVFLQLNDHELCAEDSPETVNIMFDAAAGQSDKNAFSEWVEKKIRPLEDNEA